MMLEYPFYELIMQKGINRGVEQGFEKGSREMSIKNILSVLKKRFPQQNLQQVSEALEAEQSIDRLMELHLTAIDTPSIEAFLLAIISYNITQVATYKCLIWKHRL